MVNLSTYRVRHEVQMPSNRVMRLKIYTPWFENFQPGCINCQKKFIHENFQQLLLMKLTAMVKWNFKTLKYCFFFTITSDLYVLEQNVGPLFLPHLCTVSKSLWNMKKKSLGLGPIFSDLVYPRDHKNAQMKIFHVYPVEKFLFFKFMY